MGRKLNGLPRVAGLREYAVTSAFNDSRFAPITKQELASLTVSVSILLVSEPSPNQPTAAGSSLARQLVVPIIPIRNALNPKCAHL